ncbi:MAG TPA: dihydrofolate reductase family protein [Ktedonobacterales bacterium]|jgi:riboflavin biosynthesis pyrimidine reductase
MDTLTPLETFYDQAKGATLPLPPELERLYGPLALPPRPAPILPVAPATVPGNAPAGSPGLQTSPYLFGNFVTTLDGVVALGGPGADGGGLISGFNKHDRMVMGLLRAVADAVIVGAGTLRSVPDHFWTARHIYPPLRAAYDALRSALGKPEPPLQVFVSARGELDPLLPVFQTGEVPVLIVTTSPGAERLHGLGMPDSVWIATSADARSVSAHEVLEAIAQVRQSDLLLLEGGPQLMGDFFAEKCLDELFLTLAPQVAGRDGTTERPGFVSGRRFAPEQPLWGELVSLKRGGSHLFLRYAFA